jgi:spore maturation protein CgeB
MRILVVGAVEGGSVPMGRSICDGFLRQGQPAAWLDFSGLQPEYARLRGTRDPEGIRGFVLGLRKRLIDEVMRFQPEMIFGMAQSPLNNVEVLGALRRAGIRLCYWLVEDFTVFGYWRDIAPHFDHFFVIQQEPFLSQLKALGCRHPHYLPTGFDDGLKTLAAGTPIPLSFVGAPYPNRVRFLQELAGPRLQIFGEGWAQHSNASVAEGARRVSEEECRQIYARTMVNLNLHSSVRAEGFGEGDFVNPRTFEIAGLGQFQLVDNRRLLPLHFDPRTEVPAYGSWGAYKHALEYFLKHEAERKEIAANAQRRVLREHTYAHRAAEILSVIRGG